MSFCRAHTSARVAFVNDLPLGAATLSPVVSWPLQCACATDPERARVGVFFPGDSSGAHHAIVRRSSAAINGPIASISIVGML